MIYGTLNKLNWDGVQESAGPRMEIVHTERARGEMERRVGEVRWTAATRVAASGKWGSEFGTVSVRFSILPVRKRKHTDHIHVIKMTHYTE